MTNNAKPNGRALVDANDPSVFTVPSQTSTGDRTSLLRLQNLVAQRNRAYVYYEVGSHLGGTLVPHLLDERCATIISIDPRPQQLPDERGQVVEYQDNSTARMISMLSMTVSKQDLTKLKTFDLDARDVPCQDLPRADLVLIDGEHTNAAAFSDFLSLSGALSSNAIIAFHDSNLVFDAITNIQRFLQHNRIKNDLIVLPDCVVAIGIGDSAETLVAALAPVKLDRRTFERESREGLHRHFARRAIQENTVPLRLVAKSIWKRVRGRR